jgi:hypothetical protein
MRYWPDGDGNWRAEELPCLTPAELARTLAEGDEVASARSEYSRGGHCYRGPDGRLRVTIRGHPRVWLPAPFRHEHVEILKDYRARSGVTWTEYIRTFVLDNLERRS